MTTIEAQRADARDLKIQEMKKELRDVREELAETECALSSANEEIGAAQSEIVELEHAATQWASDVIPELSGIRDDLRAGRDRLALDRLTRFLDRNGECWHAVAPIADPASLAFDWGQR